MSGKIKTAMVMAAGHGTRMRPLTDHMSKAMVEVGGKPLIDHMLDRLEAAGIERAVVNVHAHADHLEAHLKRRSSGPEIIISDERDELLETGGGVVKALPLLGHDPIFICNIDAVWIEYETFGSRKLADFGFDLPNLPLPKVKQTKSVLSQMIEFWNADTMDDLLLLVPKDKTLGYYGEGDFQRGWDGHLTRRSNPKFAQVYAGVQIASLPRFKNYPLEKFSRNKVWDVSLSEARMFGYDSGNFFWMHVGDPKARDEAELILTEKGAPKEFA